MYFTSYEFLGFVLVLGLLYYVLPKKAQWPLLLLGSLAFYAASGPKYLIYVAVTALSVYGAGMLMDRDRNGVTAWLKAHKEELSKEEKKAYKEKHKKVRLAYLLICLLINLGILAVLKFQHFGWVLPLGISFYTLRAVGYLVDIHRGTYEAERNPLKFLLFISFFPIILQGPISNYNELAETLYGPNKFNWKNVSFGLQRILWGFFKKLVIADRVLAAVTVFIKDPETYNGAYALFGMLLYTLELYADFTGGIDITIGVAEVLGIKVAENFDRPYFATSLKDYWRRWHITMCAWFRNYVFYPVSVCKPMQKLSKFTRKVFGEKAGKRIPVYLSSFFVWLATGVWHGATLNFIVWGLLNWLILMVSEEFEPLCTKFHEKAKFSNSFGYRIFMILRTFVLISVLNLFDCFANVGTTLKALLSIVTTGNYEGALAGAYEAFGLSAADYIILAVGIVMMFLVSLIKGDGAFLRDKIAKLKFPVQAVIWIGLFVLVLLFGAYGQGYDQSQFIYNQF